MNKQQGFTLIELMIVIAVIGILASIAVPAYGDYVVRGRLVNATSILSDSRVKLEQYFQDNRTYTGWSCPADNRYFMFSCVIAAPPASTYTLTATNQGNQGLGAAGDYSYSIDQTNTKVTIKFAGVALNQVPPATCWIMKKGDSSC
jgi:type IV pilus assembly protein PilE